MKKLNKKNILSEQTVICQYCGRSFVKPLNHKCNNGYRKNNFKWIELNK